MMYSFSRMLPHVFPAGLVNGGLGVCKRCAGVLGGAVHLHENADEKVHYIEIKDKMTILELAHKTHTNSAFIMKQFETLRLKPGKSGVSIANCEKLVRSLGHKPSYINILSPIRRPRASLVPRPPVVAVMGHVDHGKTTLLDSLRESSVAVSEAGGITQHIGAFSVSLHSGSKLTFLDTPGHAAFSKMRARGAESTDIVVLVVAADDGVKEQTLESIKMIKSARVPMLVAINKCDKPVKNIPRLKQELLKAKVQLEEYGGEVQGVEVSALKKDGLDTLEEALLLLADVLEIKGDPSGPVQGVVIETKVDKGLGLTATVLIQHGTLCAGDVLVAGSSWCKVRLLQDESGMKIETASLSSPTVIIGWKNLPTAGDLCLQAKSEQEAKLSCSDFSALTESSGLSHKSHPHRASLQQGMEEEKEAELCVPLLVKGDVMGSVEALVSLLVSRQPQELFLKVIHSGVGAISEGDVEMAISVKGIILAFGVSCPKSLATLAKTKGVKILTHKVIYKLLDLLKDELEPRLGSLEKEEELGVAHVTKVYHMNAAKPITIGGCIVDDGKMTRSALFKILRSNEVMHKGELSGMRNEKKDIDVAHKGTAVGFKFAKNFDFKEGDKIVCFKKILVGKTLKWDLGF